MTLYIFGLTQVDACYCIIKTDTAGSRNYTPAPYTTEYNFGGVFLFIKSSNYSHFTYISWHISMITGLSHCYVTYSVASYIKPQFLFKG